MLLKFYSSVFYTVAAFKYGVHCYSVIVSYSVFFVAIVVVFGNRAPVSFAGTPTMTVTNYFHSGEKFRDFVHVSLLPSLLVSGLLVRRAFLENPHKRTWLQLEPPSICKCIVVLRCEEGIEGSWNLVNDILIFYTYRITIIFGVTKLPNIP